MPVYIVKVDGKKKIVVTGKTWKQLKEEYKRESKKVELIDVIARSLEERDGRG